MKHVRRLSVAFIGVALVVGLSLVAVPAEATVYSGAIAANVALTKNDELRSPNGQYKFVVQPDGNAVIYAISSSTAIWNTGTLGSGSSNVLKAQSDGNVVLRAGTTVVWESRTYGHGTGSTLKLQNDGTLVLVDSSNNPIWASVNPTGYITSGQQIVAGQIVRPDWASGFYLTMQGDGNLVLMQNQTPVWSAGTSSAVNLPHRAILQPDGLLVIYDSQQNALWSRGAYGTTPSHFSVQPDGNLVIYTPTGTHTWARADPLVGSSVQALAAQLVSAYNSGRLTVANGYTEQLYGRQILAVANGNATAACTNDVRVYQLLVFMLSQYGSFRITDLQRPCYGSYDTCPAPRYTSIHCAQPGRAFDIDLIDGVSLDGKNSKSLDFIGLLDPHVPPGTMTGQSVCASPRADVWANIDQGYSDDCNHVHIDIPPNGALTF